MPKTNFTDGDKLLGIPGTRVLAAFLNKIFTHRHDGLDADGSAPLNYAEAAGDGAAYTASFTPALTAHITGMPIIVKIPATNTSATPTFNPDGVSAKQIQRKNGVPLCVGDMPANLFAVLVYNGSSYDLINAYLLLDAAVTTTKIMDAAVTTAKLASEAVTTAKIADLNVTTTKLADAAVTTQKIAAGAVTPDKITRSGGTEVFDDFNFPTLIGWQAHNNYSIGAGDNGLVTLGPATAGAERHGISNLTNKPFKLSGSNTLTVEMRVKLSGVVANLYYFGLMDADDLTGNGIIFAADGAAPIKAKCMSGGSPTSVSTDLNWTVNTTYNFKFVATASQVLFYVDDVLKATITTNIPTAAMGVCAFIRGSATTCAVDYVHCTSSARV